MLCILLIQAAEVMHESLHDSFTSKCLPFNSFYAIGLFL